MLSHSVGRLSFVNIGSYLLISYCFQGYTFTHVIKTFRRKCSSSKNCTNARLCSICVHALKVTFLSTCSSHPVITLQSLFITVNSAPCVGSGTWESFHNCLLNLDAWKALFFPHERPVLCLIIQPSLP